MKSYKALIRKTLDYRGDTIIEVLFAIAIAAFAIGISYATAQRSLQQAITSREHNEALDLLENQIANLQLRFNQTPDQNTFETQFGNSNSQHHFCLDDNSKNAGDTNQWTPYFNGSITVNGPLGSPPYAAACVRPSGGGATYYVDIETSASTASKSPTLYHLTARWDKIGGGTNQASLFYHLDGAATATLGAATGGGGGSILPPACQPNLPNLVANPDFNPAFNPGTGVAAGFTNLATAKFSSGLPFRGFNTYPDDKGLNPPNTGWTGGYSLWNKHLVLITGSGYISGYLEQYPFPGDSDTSHWPVDPSTGNPIPVGPVSTWWYSNPVQGINQPKGTFPADSETSYSGMIWKQTINGLKPSTTYYFAAYFDNLYSNTEPADRAPLISFLVNGNALAFPDGKTAERILATKTEPKSAGTPWQFLYTTYTTGPAETSVTIQTNDNEGHIHDDDYAMTHIGLYECKGSSITTPANCNNQTSPTITFTPAELYYASPINYNLANSWPLPTPLPAGCSFTMTVTTGDPADAQASHQVQNYENLFIEFCADITSSCTAANDPNAKSANPIYRTGDTNDIKDGQATVQTQFTIPPLPSDVKYLVFKHCSVDYWNNYPTELNNCRNYPMWGGNSIHNIQINY